MGAENFASAGVLGILLDMWGGGGRVFPHSSSTAVDATHTHTHTHTHTYTHIHIRIHTHIQVRVCPAWLRVWP